MVKSAKSHMEEEDEADGYDSSSYKGELLKVDGKSSEQKANAHRSKHSETEQRRRSKINERFQILRDLIPQNDQKRDKASFLLEVIEYIRFLQEKLQVYEGPYQGWGQEPTKLMPWRRQHGPTESFMEPSQVMKNGSAHENNVVSPAMLTNAHTSIESDLGTTAVYKALDHPSGSVTSAASLNMQMQPNMFAPSGRGGLPMQSLQECVSDAENMAYQSRSQLYPNNIMNGEEEPVIESGSISISSAYSQGILNSLTQALQSSGVDLSQASISVQFDVGKRANSGLNNVASGSRDHGNQYLNNQATTQIGVESCVEEFDQGRKRLRTKKC